jgi:hypothetical protein
VPAKSYYVNPTMEEFIRKRHLQDGAQEHQERINVGRAFVAAGRRVCIDRVEDASGESVDVRHKKQKGAHLRKKGPA